MNTYPPLLLWVCVELLCADAMSYALIETAKRTGRSRSLKYYGTNSSKSRYVSFCVLSSPYD